MFMNDQVNGYYTGDNCGGFNIIDIEIDKYIELTIDEAGIDEKYDAFIDYIFFSAIQYVMYALICLCVLLAILGWVYSFYSGADNVNVFSVILFGIYAWDF